MRYCKVGIISVITFCSCTANLSQTFERKGNEAEINLDNIKTKTEDYFLYSSMYKNVKTILLETNELCLIGRITKMRVCDKFFIVLDGSIAKSLYIFDKEGHFIRKIGNTGQGPGEYLSPSDFSVDKVGNLIYVLDSQLNRINIYDLRTGKFVRSIVFGDNNVRSHNIEYVGGILFADAYFREQSDDNYLIRIIQDPSGKIDGRFLNVKEYRKGVSNTSFGNRNVFYLRENGNAVFVQPFMDKIIEISKDSVFPLFDIKSNDVLTSEIIKSAMEKDVNRYYLDLIKYNKYFLISDFVDHGNMIQFRYQKGTGLRWILYNKQTFEVTIYQKIWDDFVYISKDANGTPLPYFGCNDSSGVFYFYDTNQVPMIHQFAKDGLLSSELNKLDELKNLDEEANPIIFFYEFKD